MDFPNYIEQKKKLQNSILAFLDQEGEEEEECFQNLQNLIHDQKIAKNKDELSALFHLISQISANHYRSNNFHNKIDKIISIFENEIKEDFLNLELFQIFKKNKRIFLYLIKNNLIFLDANIAKILMKPKYFQLRYIHYFYPELKKYITDDKLKEAVEKDVSQYDQATFEKLREQGENESEICQIIRNDSVSDFTPHVSEDRSILFKPIAPSIFETNTFLIKNNPGLIEYSAYYGSIQIFKYLQDNNCRLMPELWLYSVHGKNFEIFEILENRPLRPKDYTFGQVLDESFKCHNSEVTNYIIEKLLKPRTGEENDVMSHSIKYYNYQYFPDDLNNQFTFCYFCYADYYSMVNELVNLSNKKFEINEKIATKISILYFFFKWCFQFNLFLNGVLIQFFLTNKVLNYFL